MKIDVAYGRDIDDSTLEQLQYLEVDACAFYASLDSDPDSKDILIGIIPTESLKHFKRRVANILFLTKTKKAKSGKTTVIAMACISKKGGKADRFLHTVYVKPLHRRMGIGTAILKKALSIAKKDKLHLSLGVNPLNKIAMHLYESLGFNICKNQSITMDFDASHKTICKKVAK